METLTATTGRVVFTNKARCRDCYRCVRVCPVKAIRLRDGQAAVIEERCIACGTCVRECPQEAKSVRNDVERVADLLRTQVPVAISVAPSFAVRFSAWERRRLPSALRKLGFRYVAETAVGADSVAHEMAALVRRADSGFHIASACPAVVRYIERYHPALVPALVPLVSPMMAHARMLRLNLGAAWRIVFTGPCIAKKAEAERPELAGLVDGVLTFQELTAWMRQAGIDLATCEDSAFDGDAPAAARFFPLAGGSLKPARLSTDLLEPAVISITGFDDLETVLRDPSATAQPTLIEPLFCRQGCINGPACDTKKPVFTRRQNLLAFIAEQADHVEPSGTIRAEPAGQARQPDLETKFQAQPVADSENIPEVEIKRVLAMTGKAQPQDQLNCGACGYANCRDKAIAVIRNMAEPEMCLPYMRRLAEQRTDRILETSPNGIVILDEHLQILSMNPAFRRFFMCSEAVCGKRIAYLMDPHQFEQLAAGDHEQIESVVKHAQYNLMCHQIFYALREEKQYVGIFVNITANRANQDKLDTLRAQALLQAEELLQHQIAMAQKIGRFLGESAAQGEQLVANLQRIVTDDPGTETPREGGLPWAQGRSTLKR